MKTTNLESRTTMKIPKNNFYEWLGSVSRLNKSREKLYIRRSLTKSIIYEKQTTKLCLYPS